MSFEENVEGEEVRKAMYEGVVIPVIMCESEIGSINVSEGRKQEVLEMKFWRSTVDSRLEIR